MSLHSVVLKTCFLALAACAASASGSVLAPHHYPDTNDTPCPTNTTCCPDDSDPTPEAKGCGSCGGGIGMAAWRVSEPYINLWLTDEPLGYKPGLGKRVSFRLNYKQRETRAGTNSAVFSCGQKWNCSWISYVIAPAAKPPPAPSMRMVLPYGGERGYTADGATPEYYSRSVMSVTTDAGGALTGCTVVYPSGASEAYNRVFTDATGDVLCFRTAQTDPAGHGTQFIYTNSSGNIFLLYVIDTDGRTNTLGYANASFPSQITGVTDPFGRNTTLKYSSAGLLTNITDVLGLSSAFAYDANQWVSSLTTPYGATTFSFTDNNLATNDAIDRSVLVVDAMGGTNLFVSRYQASFLNATSYAVPHEPAGAPAISSANMSYLNTWHWGPIQYQQLSTSNKYAFTAADYLKGRQRNWLAASGASGLNFSDALNMEQAISPDGSTPGQQTWSAYDGEGASVQGTNVLPAVSAWSLPDGNGYYQWTQRNVWGNPLCVQETWSQTFGGASLTRSNQYFYAANGMDLLSQTGPLGETVAAYSYDTRHNILTASNAVGDLTAYTFDGQSRLTSVTTPTGLTETNIYFSSGPYTNWIQQQIDIQINRTNSYLYANDLVASHTNELGLAVSYTWDDLQRLTSTVFPDGTYVSNIYVNLDRTQNIDRLGDPTQYGYDAMRRLVAVTNALGNVTRYNYCICGALESIQDALGQITSFSYDIAGRRINVLYPDLASLTNNYNALSQITNITDGLGLSMTNWYTDQGLLYASSNAAGQVFLKSFDMEDRMTNSVDGNGVATAMTYDNLKRTLSRSYPDGGVESFVYSAFGLTAYTNQLTNISYYAYDAARRKIAETNALTQVSQYGYDPSGGLVSLIDAKGNVTQWSYDAYGRVTNKVDARGATILSYQYDAGNRLTNRWSLAKGNTAYAYDNAGNLTNINYPASHPLSFSYDAMNRMISMSDAIGTTAYGYTPAGQLASETGPWPSDAVAYTYADRRRTGLDLQQASGSDWMQSYAYDMAGRMIGLSSPAGAFNYAYNPGLAGITSASSLLAKIALPNGAFITNTYDHNARMLGTWLYNSSANVLDSSVYTYNAGNQRTAVERGGENTAAYSYDAIGEVVADQSYEVSGGTARLNEQLRYGFDPAGNLNYRTNNTLIENFQVDPVNELTVNSNTGALTVTGTTTPRATGVTVNGASAALYADATFAATNLPLTTTYTAIASDGSSHSASNSVTVSIATNAAFQYDGNGNLTNDGLRSFAYDDENQLIQVWVTNQWFSQFTYDARMRRRIRQEFAWQGGAWVQTNAVYYIYDGNLVIQERDANNAPSVTYTRGEDLDGRLDAAGGIGGLLAWTALASAAVPLGQNYYHCDANGNITMLINTNQQIVAKYLYDAFGNLLSKSGLFADVNLYRFSSKEVHPNSGLVYYLFRYYDPNLQRWANRDPIMEMGGINLYGFVGNSAPNGSDILGLVDCKALEKEIDELEARLGNGAYRNRQALERRIDQLENIYSRLCWTPPPPDPPPGTPDPCTIKVPTQPPPNSNNNQQHPPIGPTVPPIVLIPIIEECAEALVCLLAL